jgi:hypothetical protein
MRPPPTSSGVSQNLAAAAMLLRVMPEPSTIEGRRIQGELKNLLEDAAVRWAESSASRRQGYPSEHRAATSRFMREASVHTGRTRNTAPAPQVALATSTITATVGPTSTRGCAEATTPGVGDATTAGRIGVPRPNHPVRRLSAAPYDDAVPNPVPNPDYYHKVLGGDETGTVARGLPAGLPAGWNG